MAVDTGTQTGVLSDSLSKRAKINLIIFIYFFSGACSLIDQVVWVRLLKLTLGNTVYAASIVVSVFMGGLALGAFIMGRYSDNIKHRLKLYAFLETAITIVALTVPFALQLADRGYIWFFQNINPSKPVLLFIQILVSTVIVLIPSMIMGSTLPLLGRFITGLEREAGHLVGKLYALNTLGAALGCFLAGFVLIRSLGVMGTLYFAAVLNLLVAFGGWLLSYTEKTPEEIVEETVAATKEVPPVRSFNFKFFLLIIAFFMSGVISIGYELLWMRTITHFLGGVTYVFSAVLTVYLLGDVIGAGIGSRLAKSIKSPAIGFAVTLLLLGVFGIFFVPFVAFWVSSVLPGLNEVLGRFYQWFPATTLTLEPLIQSFLLFLLPSIFMGIGFPLALQAWANHLHKVGLSTGTAYSFDTIGAVLGGVVTGFVLIPLMGLQISITLLGLAGLWIAATICFAFSKRWLIKMLSPVLGIVITVGVFFQPTNLFDKIINESPFIPDFYELLAVKEGITTTVSVHRDLKQDTLQIYSAGQALAGEDLGTRVDQKFLGHFGLLLNSDANSALSVGFGSGETTKCLSLHNLERLDCAEIAPEVVEVSLQFFNHINLGDRLHDEVNMIFMDAKNYIHLTDVKYDVITNDSIHPRHFAENASLYGKEFYADAKDCLNDNGVMVIWVPIYVMPMAGLDSITGTLLDVFPHVTLWYPYNHHANYYWLVASKNPQRFSPRHIDEQLQDPAVKESLAFIGLTESYEILNYYVTDERNLRKHLTGYNVNSDYTPFVEFNTDSDAPMHESLKKFVLNTRDDSIIDHMDWSGFNESDKEQWLANYEQLYSAAGYLLSSYGEEKLIDRFSYTVAGLSEYPGNRALIEYKEELEKGLVSRGIRLVVNENYNAALAMANEIQKIDSSSATIWMIRSTVMQATGDFERAIYAAEQAISLDPNNSEVYFNAGFVYWRAKQFGQSVKNLRQSLDIKPEQLSILKLISELLLRDPKSSYYSPEDALEFISKANELSEGEDVEVLNILADAYFVNGETGKAIEAIEQAIQVAGKDNRDLLSMLKSKLERYKAKLLKF